MTWRSLSLSSLKNSPRLRIMLWALLICVPMGVVQFCEPIDLGLMIVSNRLRSHPASGSIVVAGFDVKTGEQLGGYPWSRAEDAKFIDAAFKAGARRVFYDKTFFGQGDRIGDEALVRVLDQHRGRVFLGMAQADNRSAGQQELTLSHPKFTERATSVSLAVELGFNGYPAQFFRVINVKGTSFQALAAALASHDDTGPRNFRADYAISARSIPTVSYVDVISRKNLLSLAGKDIVGGATALYQGDRHWVPGQGNLPGVYAQVIAAETLRQGVPIDAGLWPGLIVASLIAAISLSMKRHKQRWAILVIGIVGLIATAIFAPFANVDLDNATALAMLTIVGVRMNGFMRAHRNLATDLPNLNALERDPRAKTETLVSIRVHNYPEIVAQLGGRAQRPLADEVGKRLRALQSNIELYQSDEGSFVFTTPLKIDELADHLEGAYTLLLHPISIGTRRVDLRLGFGVDDAPGKAPLTIRLANIMVAGLHTRGRAKKWLKIDDEFWGAELDLSIMGDLDEAIERGKLDVVYQPQFDLRTRAVVGFEALARWHHPVRGPVSPIDFIRAAEETRRIGGLTEYVLNRSLETASRLRAMGCVHAVSVNLSSSLLGDDKIVGAISRLLKAHAFPASQLTMELTETGPIDSQGAANETLARLRALGVRLSIDDFGTGTATLEYFTQVQTDEIKIDRQFVIGLIVDPGCQTIVRSAIEMAHANGRMVVAEGIESPASADRLAEMGCDIGQGYGLGRPVDFDSLVEVITGRPRLIHVSRFVPANH